MFCNHKQEKRFKILTKKHAGFDDCPLHIWRTSVSRAENQPLSLNGRQLIGTCGIFLNRFGYCLSLINANTARP